MLEGEDIICEDYMMFQERLKALRKFDDSIVYEANKLFTNSFNKDQTTKCTNIYYQLSDNHKKREDIIKNCIIYTKNQIKYLISDSKLDDNTRKCRDLQSKLRFMQNELNIDEIIKERSLQVLKDRCKSYLKVNST